MIDSDTLKGNVIFLSLGSNLGDKRKNIQSAIVLIRKRLGPPGAVSQVFESVSWGYTSEHLFYNCCLSVSTQLEPLPVMEELLSIERILGRERGKLGYSDRLIDIDLLFFGDLLMDHPRLKLPHPSIPLRRFVLKPLSEIAAGLIHPGNGLTVLTMLEQCRDMSEVRPI